MEQQHTVGPLELLARSGGRDLKAWLTEQYGNAPGDDLEYDGCLHEAAQAGDMETLQALVQNESYRVHVHTKATWSRGFLPCTPLRVASTAGRSHCVRLLLAAGARVDDLDVKGQTALHVAVVNGWLECVRILLCAGAAPDGSPHHNSSPLHHACREGRDDILSELIRYGAEIDLAFSRSMPACLSSSPLYTSATHRHLSCFQKLLQAGADPNQSGQSHAGTSERSHCLLVDTLRLGCHLPFQQLLVDFGADLTLLPWDELEEHDHQGKAMDDSVCYLRQVKVFWTEKPVLPTFWKPPFVA